MKHFENLPEQKIIFQNFAKIIFFWNSQWKQFEYFSRIFALKNYFGFEVETLRKFFIKNIFLNYLFHRCDIGAISEIAPKAINQTMVVR